MRCAFSTIMALLGMSMMFALAAMAMPLPSSAETTAGQVAIRLTTGDGLHKFLSGTANFSPANGSNPFKIQVTDAIRSQQMDGFGAALTDYAAWLIAHTLDVTRTQILSDLFSPDGIGISYVRLPMGASEFVITTTLSATQVITYYTYDDLPIGQTDVNLTHFSIAHDRTYIIPILQQARRLNPELRFMASPWSAPAWMKTPGTLDGGSLDLQYCQVYANYFVKFIQAYEAEGIPIDAVTVQNEPYNPITPNLTTNLPVMHMNPSDQAYFLRNCLGPAFVQHGIHTKILIWDHNWDRPDYPLTVLSDPTVRGYIDGSAWHCYAGTPAAQTVVHDAYPDKGIYFTECTGHGDEHWPQDLEWGVYTGMISTTRHWAKTVLYWNLVLDEKHGPQLGGCTDCRGLLTIGPNGAVTKTVEYYVVGHLSKFVDPGAFRIESSDITGTLETVAFQNPDKSVALLVLNRSDQPQSFDVQWNGQSFEYRLEPKSVATFKWNTFRVYLPFVVKDYH